MTRARDRLTLLVPQRFHVGQQRGWGDRHLYATQSRFIAPEMEGAFEVVRPPPAATAPDAAPGAALLDLGAALGRRWSPG
jgi:DNA helicase-2/ATP-dependent DNA helicase PcrA